MLASRLRDGFRAFAERTALWIAGQPFSYRQLKAVSSRIQEAFSPMPRSLPIGIVTTRSLSAYAGVLGAVFDGRPYLPLNADYPLDRLLKIVDSAGAAAIVLGTGELDLGVALQSAAAKPITLILVDNAGDRAELIQPHDRHLSDHGQPILMSDDEPPAYIMFTSGTTGVPKGIAISWANLEAYLAGIEQLFDFSEDDRFSQFFNLSFDLSVHDMFVAWTHGASLHVPSKAELMDPVGFARGHELTVWFSVPSAASLAMRFRKLRENGLPTLRHALFCGEALSGEVARAFAAAAPNAAITNLYGPTEATIAITACRLPGSAASCDDGIVPIGSAFLGQETLVLKDDLTAVASGEVGELWLGGSQIAGGYTNNPDQTRSKFRRFSHPGHSSEVWYATGDLVEEHPEHGLLYRGQANMIHVAWRTMDHGQPSDVMTIEEAERHLRLV